MFAHGETVTRLRGTPVTDPYSGQATGVDWDAVDELDIVGCGFNPGRSSEPSQVARDAVTTQPELYTWGDFPDVRAGDRIVRRGTTYDVDGEPLSYDRHPMTGWAAGMVIKLKRVEG